MLSHWRKTAQKEAAAEKERKEDSLRNLWTNSRHPKIHIIGVSEGEEKEEGAEYLFEKNENNGKLP